MNFLQKTLLTALPCVLFSLAPTAANADNGITEYFGSFNSTVSQNPEGDSKADSLIAKAKNFIGLPYRFGGTSPTSGFDCSGFMQYVYKQTANINLPRTSGSMAQVDAPRTTTASLWQRQPHEPCPSGLFGPKVQHDPSCWRTRGCIYRPSARAPSTASRRGMKRIGGKMTYAGLGRALAINIKKGWFACFFAHSISLCSTFRHW